MMQGWKIMKKHMGVYRFVTVLMALILSLGSLGLSSAQPSTLESDRLFFCNFTNQPSQGSVADWWANAAPAGVDCIDLSIVNSPETCSLTATFTSYVYASVRGEPFAYTDRLSWYETDANGVVIRAYEGAPPTTWGSTNYGTGSFTVSFPEDYNGGTTWVLINFNSPESDIGVGLSDYDKAHWRTTSAGVIYPINTNCQQEVVYGCSQGFYKNNGALYPALNSTLVDLGFYTNVKPGTTLLQVISNPKKYDGYTRQQVTAYLNWLYVDGFALDGATILAGGYDQATLEWNNHGAYGDGYIGDCPLD